MAYAKIGRGQRRRFPLERSESAAATGAARPGDGHVRRDGAAAAGVKRGIGSAAQLAMDPVLAAAWLYFEEGLKQDEIAARLGISRASVFNLLQKAREEGVVTITVDAGRLELVELGLAVAERFDIRECFVLPAAETAEPLHHRIGRLGARVLDLRVVDGDVVGVAWGRTVMALSKAITQASLPNASVAQITGSSLATYDFSPELCTSNIAVRLGARCINLHAPGLVSTAEVKTILMREPIIDQHFQLLRSCTKTLFGVTHLGSETLLEHSGFMSDRILREYTELGAVGFVAGHFFDIAGRPVVTELDGRHVVMPLADFMAVPERICVGGGPDKGPAIVGMLTGGYANVLVTDEATARELIARTA